MVKNQAKENIRILGIYVTRRGRNVILIYIMVNLRKTSLMVKEYYKQIMERLMMESGKKIFIMDTE